jgi:hypothetical protein
MTTEQDFSVRIETTEHMDAVFVDKFDDDQLWLSVKVKNGGAHVVLTFEQAREMQAAISRILESK